MICLQQIRELVDILGDYRQVSVAVNMWHNRPVKIVYSESKYIGVLKRCAI